MNFAVTAIGRDRPGIVAAVTGVLREAGANVDDSQMSILHGQFAIVLIANLPGVRSGDPALDHLTRELERTGRDLDLAAVTVSPVSELDRGAEPTHLLTVYGADRPGIVHDVSQLLAALGVNITDLRTRRTGAASSPLYTLMVELSLPDGPHLERTLATQLDELAAEGRVEVRLSGIETELL